MRDSDQRTEGAAFAEWLSAHPGEWFRCPSTIAAWGPEADRRSRNVRLDPSMFEIYRDGGPQGPLYARRKPRPDGLPVPASVVGYQGER